MSKETNKTSNTLKDVISKARQVGDTKVDKQGRNLVWTEVKPGKFDWRIDKSKSSGGSTKSKPKKATAAQTRKVLESKPNANLVKYASSAKNDPNFRQISYDILVERGYDVSDIDMNNGKLGQMKTALAGGDDGDIDMTQAPDVDLGDIENDEEFDWTDQEQLSKMFGGLKTKKQRIQADNFVHKLKTNSVNYEPVKMVLGKMNGKYISFLQDDSPLMLVYGDAGVGKSYNFKNVTNFLSLKEFDPETDEPGDGDYDWVKAPSINSGSQLLNFLKEHNGKIALFDDNDAALKRKDISGVMKNATDLGGKRIIGKAGANGTNVDSFEYTGKICFLTNMDTKTLTSGEDSNAIFSRATSKMEINFTKREHLYFIEATKYKSKFTGVRDNPDEDEHKKERDEVYKVIKDNIDDIDPKKFNSRTFAEALILKQTAEKTDEVIKNNPAFAASAFLYSEPWEDTVINTLTKGYLTTKEEKIEKAFEILKFDEE